MKFISMTYIVILLAIITMELGKEVETRDTVISSSTICATETSPINPNYKTIEALI